MYAKTLVYLNQCLCWKGETNCISTGPHYDETGEKTIYLVHKLSAYNKHWHSSFAFYFILWYQLLYKSWSSNLIICYSFNGQIIHVWCLYKNILKTVHSQIRNCHLTPYQLGVTRSLTSMSQHIRYWCLVQFPLKNAHANACKCAH